MNPTVILAQPQIPQNTGNIVRTCSCTGAKLTLVKPLGFSTSDRMLKRAGLDYWEGVEVDIVDDLEDLLSQATKPFYLFSSKGTKSYTEGSFRGDEWLVFGSETTGISEAVVKRYPDRVLTIPMIPGARCLNLSNAVAIVLYEAWRQSGEATTSTT